MTVGPVTMTKLPINRAKDILVLKIISMHKATPNQVITTPTLRSLWMMIEVWVNSLRSSVKPPSKSMIATAKEMNIGRKSPKAFGSKKSNPSGPSRNPPKSKSTKVGKCNFLESVVRKQPAPTAKQSVHKAELLLEIELRISSNIVG